MHRFSTLPSTSVAQRMRRRNALAYGFAILTSGCFAAQPASAQVYNAAMSFSSSNNPNGLWSYGYEDTLGGAFTLYTNKLTETTNVEGWNLPLASQIGDIPHVVENLGTTTANYADVVLAPGQLAFHPGPQGQFSIIRFTAPTVGTYTINADWSGVTTDGTTSDAHVLFEGVPDATFTDNQVTGTYNNPTNSPFYTKSVFLTSGETVDFAVGKGNDGSYVADTTGLDATLTPAAVPEASTTVSLGLLLMLGIGGAVVTAWKKKAATAA